jgi:hypothetical protein
MHQSISTLQGMTTELHMHYPLSRIEKDEDEPISEKEAGLLLAHAMRAVERDEPIVMPKTKA